MIILVTIVLLILVLITLIPLNKKRKKKEAIFSLFVYTLSYIELLLYVLKSEIPSYLELIQITVEFLTNQ